MDSAEREEHIRKYVDSLIGPDRIVEAKISEPELREAVKAELIRRGCQVSPGNQPDVLIISCP